MSRLDADSDKHYSKRPWDISCPYPVALLVIDVSALTARSASDISECLGYSALPGPTKLLFNRSVIWLAEQALSAMSTDER